MATRALQQVISYLAWNTSTNVYVTGDVANHSTSWSKDGTRSATTNAPAEVDATNLPGLYKVTMTATETDCIEGVLGGKSSTANVVLIPTMVAFDYLNTSAPATAGVPDVNMKNVGNQTATAAAGVTFPASIASPTNITAATGVDITKILGTAISTPATAGILDVNVKNMNNVAATAITTVKAVQGLTTADQVTTVSGNVNGSVGSVAGNVAGSVGSVTAAVSTTDWTTQLTESYRANGAAPTPAQAVHEILAHLGESSISGTTKTVKKLDHATAAETFTLDSATTPASITRAT